MKFKWLSWLMKRVNVYNQPTGSYKDGGIISSLPECSTLKTDYFIRMGDDTYRVSGDRWTKV